ncbi:hypothetical protein PCC9214_02788 [Planktothrix tepida]|nr:MULTISPECIES: hypothetical protein [Planktothrix]CAD5954778.1 hypothetical protein PCC9214_02788 [Planktothrix tepida]CAD5955819.1 hypothetical protein NO713_02872 [Planktothrix pseudagardhii]
MKRLSLTQILLIVSLMVHTVRFMGDILPYNQPAFASPDPFEVKVNHNCPDGNTGGTK